MYSFRVVVQMRDGSRGRHYGIYPNGCAAIVRAMELFPLAARISAKCLTQKTHTHPPTDQPRSA